MPYLWQHKSGSTLAQVMDCCLMVPITWNNAVFSLVKFCGIQLSKISQWVPRLLLCIMILKIALLQTLRIITDYTYTALYEAYQILNLSLIVVKLPASLLMRWGWVSDEIRMSDQTGCLTSSSSSTVLAFNIAVFSIQNFISKMKHNRNYSCLWLPAA